MLQAVTPEAEIQGALMAAHRDFVRQSNDPFQESTVPPSIAGTLFTVRFPFREGQTAGAPLGGSGLYSYRDGVLILSLYTQGGYTAPRSTRRTLIRIATRERAGRPYVGANAFGAHARVEVNYLQEDSLASIGQLPASEADLTFETFLRPAEARHLALNALVVVEGFVTYIDNQRLTECARISSPARLDSPTDIRGTQCWLGARITRIAFIDRRSGNVLREWRQRP